MCWAKAIPLLLAFRFLLASLSFSSVNSGAVHTTLLLLCLPFIGKCRQRIMTSLKSTKAANCTAGGGFPKALLNSTYEERIACSRKGKRGR